MIDVLLTDDHALVRAGLRRIVDGCSDMHVVAEADDGAEALQIIDEIEPDVVVLDIAMPKVDGLEVLSRLRSSHPDLPVVVLTMHTEEPYVVRAIEAGAMGYVTKQSAPEELVAAIRRVIGGRHYVTSQVAEALALRTAQGRRHGCSPVSSLSLRELQVLRRLALGATNREIARDFHISVKTVDTHRLRVLKKLGLRNNAELSRFAIQNDITTASQP